MTKLIARLLVSMLALVIVARVLPGIEVESLYTAFIVALILGVLNTIVRPILVVLTLPITVLTLGLFIFVINAGIFWFVSTFVDGFQVEGLLAALLGALLVSVISTIGNKLVS
jgi:putative membrane protein